MLRSKYVKVKGIIQLPLIVRGKKCGFVTIDLIKDNICVTTDDDRVRGKINDDIISSLAFTLKTNGGNHGEIF